MKRTLMFLLASSLLFAFGCDKKGGSVLSALESSQEVPSEHWDKSLINGFLPYIPADSAIVYISTRAMDLDSPHINDNLTKTAQVLRDKKARAMLVDGAAGIGSLQLYDAFIELTSNYENTAPQWGLDPKGRIDSALYYIW